MGLGENLRKAIEKLKNSSELDKAAVKEAVKEMQRALISADVEIALVLKLSREIEEEAFSDLPGSVNRREFVIKLLHDKLAQLLGGASTPPEKPRRILLCGLYGQGKTTSCGKVAKWYSKRGMKVGLIAADVFRPAAAEQLRTVAERAKAQFYSNEKEKNAAKVVAQGLDALKDCDLIICDSAGRSALDGELIKEMQMIDDAFRAEHKWLVIGADVGQVAKKQAQAFHEIVGVNGVVVTRMDGSAKGGGALAACASTGAKVYFLGTGEKTGDLQEFDATRYLGRVMGYGDLQALLEKAQEVTEEEGINAEELLENEFTLETFYQQMKAARKMGPLGKVLDMMGMGAQVPKEISEMGEQKLNKYGYIIDSMTSRERKDPDTLNKSRIARIARGSGTTQENVRELLKNFKKMKKVFRQFSALDTKKFEDGKGINMQKLQKMFTKKKKFKLR
ncbi:MAG TPA: signal recognition particle protein [Candidatus Diapherotrites archaeon]|uniref:Signal recognition particle 54 kDa protein n=1 Tax=Candidatus Iainarchaeum sp. TaxID=3101447 RepID=A0A7J4IZG0_9ARCH|nr:signal recognition particle protein [Candidatus Diapherotrites archaeon]